MDQLTKDRQRFLLSELNSVSSYRDRRDPTIPPEVRAAQKVLARYHKLLTSVSNRHRKAVEKSKTAIRHEIYFGDQRKASRMIQALKSKAK
jgi:hypothetical protein